VSADGGKFEGDDTSTVLRRLWLTAGTTTSGVSFGAVRERLRGFSSRSDLEGAGGGAEAVELATGDSIEEMLETAGASGAEAEGWEGGREAERGRGLETEGERESR
jgi:hypothetical protein